MPFIDQPVDPEFELILLQGVPGIALPVSPNACSAGGYPWRIVWILALALLTAVGPV